MKGDFIGRVHAREIVDRAFEWTADTMAPDEHGMAVLNAAVAYILGALSE